MDDYEFAREIRRQWPDAELTNPAQLGDKVKRLLSATPPYDPQVGDDVRVNHPLIGDESYRVIGPHPDDDNTWFVIGSDEAVEKVNKGDMWPA